MGRFSNYKKVRPRDFWSTVDPDAVKPLIPWIKGKKYAEPCCGSGSLINLIGDNAECVWASDVENTYDYVKQGKAEKLTREDMLASYAEVIITNPPFSWDMLQPILNRLPLISPTWLLLPDSFASNKRSAPYMATCSRMVAIGRLYWLEDKPVKGTDNYCWFFWPHNPNKEYHQTVFYERGYNLDAMDYF